MNLLEITYINSTKILIFWRFRKKNVSAFRAKIFATAVFPSACGVSGFWFGKGGLRDEF